MMLMLVPMASHVQKSHVVSLFDHLDLKNGMVPLITLLASCDTDTSITGITSPNKLCCISFKLSQLNKYSSAIDDAIGFT